MTEVLDGIFELAAVFYDFLAVFVDIVRSDPIVDNGGFAELWEKVFHVSYILA